MARHCFRRASPWVSRPHFQNGKYNWARGSAFSPGPARRKESFEEHFEKTYSNGPLARVAPTLILSLTPRGEQFVPGRSQRQHDLSEGSMMNDEMPLL